MGNKSLVIYGMVYAIEKHVGCQSVWFVHPKQCVRNFLHLPALAFELAKLLRVILLADASSEQTR